MGKGPSSRAGWRHHQFRARAKTRVDDLQEMFSGLQSARKDSRSADAAVLEEQLHLTLHEWRAELSAPSPASSLQVPASFASFRAHFSFLFPRRGWRGGCGWRQGNNREMSDPPSETLRMLQLAAAKEEEDDATSKLVDQLPPLVTPANQGQGGGQDMKLEPGEEAVSVAMAQQQPPLGPGGLVNGGVFPAPTAAAAVFHDQV
jgi:hypothetical protein